MKQSNLAQTAAPRTGPGESSMGVVRLPSGGQLPSTAGLASMPVLSAGNLPVTASSGSSWTSPHPRAPSHLGSMGGRAGLTLTTPWSTCSLLQYLPSLTRQWMWEPVYPPCQKSLQRRSGAASSWNYVSYCQAGWGHQNSPGTMCPTGTSRKSSGKSPQYSSGWCVSMPT